MKKVLLLTYYWPPSGGPGVQRWLKNAVFLRDFGWDCIVITPKEPVASSTDLSLLNEVPDDNKNIKRIRKTDQLLSCEHVSFEDCCVYML